MEALNVEMVIADKTKPRADIDLDLKRFDRSNIPVNIIVPADPNQPYILMPEVFTTKDAIKALEQAAGGVAAVE